MSIINKYSIFLRGVVIAAAGPGLTGTILDLWCFLGRPESETGFLSYRESRAGFVLLNYRLMSVAALSPEARLDELRALPSSLGCVVTQAANLFDAETGTLNEEVISALTAAGVAFLLIDPCYQVDCNEEVYSTDGPMPGWLSTLISRNLFEITLFQRVIGDEPFHRVGMGPDCGFNLCDFRLGLNAVFWSVIKSVLFIETPPALTFGAASFNNISPTTGEVRTPTPGDS